MRTLARQLLVLFVGGVVAIACARPVERPPSVGEQAWLTQVIDEPRGANCPNGGAAIQEGTDGNDDAILSPSEVQRVRYVCASMETVTLQTLVRISSEPVGPNCTYGGSVVAVGADVDGEGTLSDTEVQRREYLCESAPPLALSRVVSEPRGEHCAAGGKAVLSGIDLDRDAQLAPEEVTSTDYVCDVRELTRVDDEPAGSHCLGGGAAVRTGIDANGDGSLDASEVATTEYVCDRVVSGAVSVGSQADLDALAEIEVITGSLSIAPGSPETVELPALRMVGGNILVTGNTVKSLSFPVLESASSILVGGTSSLEQVALPLLRKVETQLSIGTASALSRIQLPALWTIEVLELNDLPALTQLDLSVLSRIGQLELTRVGLPNLSAPQLCTAEDVSIRESQTQSVAFPVLSDVSGSVEVLDLPRLESLSVPALGTVGGEFTVDKAGLLTELHLSLSAVGGLSVWTSPLLRVLDLPYLFSTQRSFSIGALPALEQLSAPSLVLVGRQLGLSDLPALVTAPDLGKVSSIGTFLYVVHAGFARLELPELTRADSLYLGGGTDSPALVEVVLPRLQTLGGLYFEKLSGLTTLEVPALRVVSGTSAVTPNPPSYWGFVISDVAQLPRCRVDAVLAQLAVAPSKISVTGIDDAATCP